MKNCRNKLIYPFNYLLIIVFFSAFNFSDNFSSGWQLQLMPSLNNTELADIIFLDSLNGYAVTGNFSGGQDTNYVLKTTNSGYNWTVVFTYVRS